MRIGGLFATLLCLLLLVSGSPPVGAQDQPPLASEDPGPASVVAYVPVLRFWDGRRDVALEEIRAAVEGRGEAFSRVVVAAEDPSALWASLEVTPGGSVVAGSVEEVREAVEGSRRTLGLMPAGQVRANVRALSIDGLGLFGADRVADLDEWPLVMPGEGAFDPGATWTLLAGGDVMLDREPYRKSVMQGKGPDYPWDGGYAEITSRTCCTKDGGPAITTRRVGPRGAVRELLSSADIAIVNHEAPAPNDHSYHPGGLVFTVDPDMLEGVADAGIDIVTLANNHIRNAGSKGVLETIRNVRAAGVRTVGAGKDPERARKPACFERGDTRVCLLGYNEVAAYANSATEARAGAAELRTAAVRHDVRKARRDGADVVVVLPHWGAEYVTSVEPKQRRWARAMTKAGADIVLGAHSHVVGPIEFIDGVPVLYSMGDLIFDLPRFEATEEGVLVELTFHGAELAQVELHPTVIVDRSQLHLLARDGDGEVVIKRMRAASKKLR